MKIIRNKTKIYLILTKIVNISTASISIDTALSITCFMALKFAQCILNLFTMFLLYCPFYRDMPAS